jgi:Na+/H+ antiporter NhaD/arsenite permease-like protein
VEVSFWQFARVGLVVTLLTTVLEIGVLALEHHLLPFH